MSFRARLILFAAAAAAVAVAVASAVTYVVVRDQLRAEVDDALRERARAITRHPIEVAETEYGKFFLDIPRPILGGAPGYYQLVQEDGRTARPPRADVPLPVHDDTLRVARGDRGTFFSDARVEGVHVRVLTLPVYAFATERTFALQIARPLTETDNALDRIKLVLFLVALGGVGLAAVLGLVVARAALAPVRRLTAATEHVSTTGDLASRIDDRGRDELSRLAGSFNTMLAALEDSARAQRQLVSDASHELRTPLTSLRTNIEVLARDRSMPDDERERLLADVVEQLAEMTALVSELVELARGERQPAAPEDVRLDLVVADAVERARRNAPRVEFRTELEESLVHAVPASIERAVSNLLDNAAKWSPEDAVVEVAVAGGEVLVRDHGPGIDDSDLPFVFDRFYRAATARGRPGSGLGLAIVRQVAESHGGTVTAERAAGGGTLMRLRIPTNGSSSA